MLDNKNDEFLIFDDDDEMIFELTADDKTLDELLAERELTFEQAFGLAERYISDYKDLLDELNLSGLSRGRLWAEFVRSCKMEMTEQKRKLLCVLLTGGWLLESDYVEDDFEDYGDYQTAVVRAWLDASHKGETLSYTLQKRREKRAEYQEILERFSEVGKPKKLPQIDNDHHCAIFNLLCDDEYRHENAKLDNLKQNVINIQAVISMYPELGMIAPLVYFRIYCKNNNKLYREDYVPTVNNLFNYQKYSFIDNGKNFKQYAKYFKLYLDLFGVFSDADTWLCEQGFLFCSNLAEWGVEHIEISENLPLTDLVLVNDYKPSIYDDSSLENPFWHDENVFTTQLWDWQEKHKLLDSAAEEAVQKITFDELETFLADTNRFCEDLLQKSVLNDRVTQNTYNIARALLMARIEGRFDELLAEEIAELTSK